MSNRRSCYLIAAAACLPNAATLRPHSLHVAAATTAYRGDTDLVHLQASLRPMPTRH